jgi:CelD/BcsL family acetyltransferase involved in cellulose biosynthesis
MREHSGSTAITSSRTQLSATLGTFYKLHMARWQDREQPISHEHSDPSFQPFLREICARCSERGWLRLMALKAGDQTIASSINFLLHDRWSGYMKGFDPAWQEARPGTVLDALRIQQAIAEGAKQFDMGRGAEDYKSGYGVRIERNTRVLLGTNAPRSLLAYTLLLRHIRRQPRNQD